MLAFDQAPVKIRFSALSFAVWAGILLIVETANLCALAQQGQPQDGSGQFPARPGEGDEAGEGDDEAAREDADEAARKEALSVLECQRLVALAVGKVAPMEIFPELLEKSRADNTVVAVSLEKRNLELKVDDATALSCPIACGRAGMETRRGTFAVAEASDRPPGASRYGSLVDARGNLLLRGVYSHLDPVPAGATFVASPPTIQIVLAGGVTIHSGDANGTASTDGAIVIPTAAARTLFRVLVKGMPVKID